MLGIPRRYSHYVFGVIQSGLTSAVAAAIASRSFFAEGLFGQHFTPSPTARRAHTGCSHGDWRGF
jgi:hypothetical protein